MILNKAQFARLTGYSPRQVTNWITAGMPCSGTGKKGSALRIDTAKAIKWLIDQADAKSGGKQTELTGERKRLVSEQATRAAMENRQRAGELLEAEDVQYVLNTAMADLRGEITGMPSRVAGELANMTDSARIIGYLKKEANRMLATCSAKLAELSQQGKAA